MDADLVITGGTVVTAADERRAAIAVRAGRIVAVDRDGVMPEARTTIDAMGLYILPGVIDTHVHLRDPGKVEREDWLSGTRAAAAGGITTILEMPLAIPSVNSAQILRDRAAYVQPRSIVDFALYGAANGENLDEVEPMADSGAVAFKTFRTEPARGRENEFVGVCCPDAGQMLQVMERTARTGLLHVVHAEEQQILNVTIERARRTGRTDGGAHALARPEVAETASVAQCIALARATTTRLQIAHLSTAGGAALIARAKDEGVAVTAETCPQYLVFTEDDLERWGPFAKCNPPLRSAETRDRLWESVNSGVIDVLGTDHSPFLVEEKEPFVRDIWGAPPGLPGLEELLPVMLTQVRDGRLTLRRLVQLTSEQPARLFGLSPRKGSIAPGSDADLVLVDLRAEQVHDHRRLQTKARGTALIYDGMTFRGLPVRTIVRGQTVMLDGEVVGEPGWGQWVRPSA